MKVICISGKAQHGKDTAAKYMCKHLKYKGYDALIIHYADLLKYICKSMFDWNGEKDEMGRHLLQYVGTDVVRKRDPNYWVDFVIGIINLFGNEWDYILIPDCRFPNEIDRLRESGIDTYTIRIQRDDYDSGLTDEQMNHPSETALDDFDFDYVIHNNDLNEFHTRLGEILSSIEIQ